MGRAAGRELAPAVRVAVVAFLKNSPFPHLDVVGGGTRHPAGIVRECLVWCGCPGRLGCSGAVVGACVGRVRGSHMSCNLSCNLSCQR